MTNLILYIQALQCHSVMTLLKRAKVKGDTVYISNKDYGDAQHGFGSTWYNLDVIAILDTIIHNKFNCPYLQFIEYPNARYYWDEEKKQYIDGQLTY